MERVRVTPFKKGHFPVKGLILATSRDAGIFFYFCFCRCGQSEMYLRKSSSEDPKSNCSSYLQGIFYLIFFFQGFHRFWRTKCAVDGYKIKWVAANNNNSNKKVVGKEQIYFHYRLQLVAGAFSGRKYGNHNSRTRKQTLR